MPFWPCADTAAIVVECSVAFFLMARQGLLFEESIGLLRKKVDTIYLLIAKKTILSNFHIYV